MTEQRKHEYRIVYMKMAETFATLSQAKRSQVGAIIVSKSGQILSQGYNGMPTGMENCCEKYDINGVASTKPEVLHAETNAILKCAKSGVALEGASLYVTLSPCFECAKVIVQSGISEVYYKEPYRNTDGLDLLNKCGIKTFHLTYETRSPYDEPECPKEFDSHRVEYPKIIRPINEEMQEIRVNPEDFVVKDPVPYQNDGDHCWWNRTTYWVDDRYPGVRFVYLNRSTGGDYVSTRQF